ncbi:hypothetical protein Leryth_025049 [Lithospermum erythrorhizon]|uniref:Bet v I/Major latex protein domain-containing protein n=1 Tax=Lithospermum erythrorhizon TaxID=34254 RepID=A0AAV3RPF6_LITER|nr:hypothetical protein Leryth_025049 [Lithospermum erythrorhizon]
MVLTGKIIREIEIKSDTDLFHELFCNKPYEVSKLTPEKVHGCELHKDDWGTHGSIICWDYTHDGKRKIAKQIMERDDEKKMVTLTLIEGDMLQDFKSVIVKIQVKKQGENKLVTWTIEYEKLNEDIEDPLTLIQYFADLTKDIEAHHVRVN